MNEADRKTISTNMKDLVKLIQFYEIDNLLIQEGVFTKLIMDDIKSEHTVEDRMIKLLEELPKRGPQAFDKFVKVLKETGQLNAVRLLKPGDVRIAIAMDTNFSHPTNETVRIGDHNDANVLAAPPYRPNIHTGHTIVEGSTLRLEHIQTNGLNYTGQDIYVMNHRVRGKCLIINNVEFEGNTNRDRQGSDADAKALDQVFGQLHFEVILRRNQSSEQMKDLLKRLASVDHSHYNALVVIILSHGEKKGVLGIDNVAVPVDNIYLTFDNENCPSLVHKPKLFFIQACRGYLFDGITIEHTVTDSKIFHAGLNGSGPQLPSAQELFLSRTSRVTDICVNYSTIEGYVANRNEVFGSWYGRALVDVLLQFAHLDELHQLLNKIDAKTRSYFSEDGTKQATERKLLGWSKNFFFNPGHYVD